MINCERCKQKTKIFKMSMFNTDMCCMKCIEVEKTHPEYEKAVKEELSQCKRRNFNFNGIGLPVGFLKFAKDKEKTINIEDIF